MIRSFGPRQWSCSQRSRSTYARSRPFRHTFYFGYTNGWFGYLPTAAAFGEGGYEPTTSVLTRVRRGDLTRHVLNIPQGGAPVRLRRFSLLAVALAFATAATDKELAFIGARAKYWAFQKVIRPPVPDPLTQVGSYTSRRVHSEGAERKTTHASPRLRYAINFFAVSPTISPACRRAGRSLPPFSRTNRRRLREGSRPPARLAALRRALGAEWLDIVRYADTNGFELDKDRPHAWRYRDYVIHSFNNDKPYDRFIQEQIAGDEMFPGDKEALIATGYLRAGSEHLVAGNIDPEESRQEVLTEIATNVGQTFLGDDGQLRPLPQPQVRPDSAGRLLPAAGRIRRRQRQGRRDRDARREEPRGKQRREPIRSGSNRSRKRLKALAKPFDDRSSEERKAKLDPQLLEALEHSEGQAHARTEAPGKERRDADQARLGTKSSRRMPPDVKATRAKLREQLHRDRDSPRPIRCPRLTPSSTPASQRRRATCCGWAIRTASSIRSILPCHASSRPASRFRRHSTRPPHRAGQLAGFARESADRARDGESHLAVPHGRRPGAHAQRFRRHGRQAREPRTARLAGGGVRGARLERQGDGSADRDVERLPAVVRARRGEGRRSIRDNRLFWRMNRKRFEAEMIRDAALSVAGTLNPQIGGRPVRIPIEPEVYDLIFTEHERDGLWPVNPDKHVQNRRGIYLYNKRSVRLPLLLRVRPAGRDHVLPGAAGIDARACRRCRCSTRASCRRCRSDFAARLENIVRQRPQAAQIDTAWRLALARPPRTGGRHAGAKFSSDPAARLPDFCLALFNRNEFRLCPVDAAHPHPAVTRRDVLVRAAHGFGSLALASLLDAPARGGASGVNPLAAKAAALSGEGEVGHLPVHGRRPEPDRHVRSQAGARKIQRPAAAGELRHRRQPVHQGRHAAAAESRGSSRSTGSAGAKFRRCSRTSRSAWTTCASSAPSTPTAPCMRRRCTR